MPRFSRKRYGRRRKKFYKRGILSRSRPKKRIIRMSALPRSIRPEVKYITAYSPAGGGGPLDIGTYAAPVIVTGLWSLAGGTLLDQRIGSDVFIKYTMIRFTLHVDPTIGSNPVIRCCAVLDKQPEVSGTPPWTDVFFNFADQGFNMNTYTNPTNTQRFKILKNRMYVLGWGARDGADVGGTGNLATVQVQWKLPINKKVRYIASNSAGDPTGGGKLIVYIWSDQSAALPTVLLTARTYFTDV